MACIPDNSPKSVILSPQTQCAECRFEIQSMLRRVQGVYSVAVDADRNTITVSGNLAPKELINTLLKVSQDSVFCVKPPVHVMPSSCPNNRPAACTSCPQQEQAYGIRVCSDAPMPVRCACTQRATAAPYCCHPCQGPQYPCHGRF